MNGAFPFPSVLPPTAQDERLPIADTNVVENGTTAEAGKTSQGAGEDPMEEGEISEGELEDIYEPRQEVPPPSSHHGPGVTSSGLPRRESREVASQQAREGAPIGKDHPPSHYWEPGQSTRERSGSYSPYLSPREIQSNGLEHSASDAIDTPRTEINQGDMDITGASILNDEDGAGQSPNVTGECTPAAVAEAKKKAQDAILRLWPLNIRYQNYLDEGIDKELLDGLFTDLGLDPAAAKLVAEQPDPPPSTRVQERHSENNGTTSVIKEPKAVNDLPKKVEKLQDKGEERKDRIARLLAAKSSKSTAPAAEATAEKSAPETAKPVPVKPTVVPKTVVAAQDVTPQTAPPQTVEPEPTMTPNAPSLPKSQSEKSKEKSKLIQQKMEALKKQREASRSAQPQAATTPATKSSVPQSPTRPSSPNINENTSGPGHSDLTAAPAQPSPDQPPTTVETSDTNGAASIPGLFLSSTPQPSPGVIERKRPVAADLNEYSDAAVHKRPFGHKRHSRPFLIAVSDDEDDTEMDIDSPDEEMAPIRRPSTPVRTASFRDYPALPDNIPHRQLSSPKTVGTPTGYGSGIDLENMNKQIEDMKRKIAEAEARKKTKQSSNGSPYPFHSQNQSKEGSAETTSAPQLISGAAAALRVELEDDAQAIAPMSEPASHPTSPAPLKLPKVRGQKGERRPPLRARVASERLPIIEAHRKEQMRHLKELQTEVARIEKEIQASLKEEERLREEVADLVPDELPQESSESEATSAEPRPEPQSMDKFPEKQVEPSNPTSLISQPQVTTDEPSSTEAVDECESTRVVDEDVRTMMDTGLEEASKDVTQVQATTEAETSVNEAIPSANDVLASEGDAWQQMGRDDADSDLDSDVAMDEAEDSSSEDGESMDEYEPTEAGVELPNHEALADSAPNGHMSINDVAVLETGDADLQGVSATSPAVQAISGVQGASETPSESGREIEQSPKPSDAHLDPGSSKSTFVPYETPLHCFHAYRFHPEFKDNVAGGLRSLTYSNKIDMQREVCPDELTSGVCPRGDQCEFQHFENMKAPDDQILLQLGGYGNFEGEQQQQYISGLRELLTDFRNRKVKDFQTIGDGIVEYRAKFQGDKTKILPLGHVAL